MCVYLYARNSMIDVDDVFNRLSCIIIIVIKASKPIKMVWVLFYVIKHKKGWRWVTPSRSIMFMNIKDFVVTNNYNLILSDCYLSDNIKGFDF